MATTIDYFPLGTAYGQAFCNRKQELHYLRHNIAASRPTLIMSPRRYGKTSLALRAFTLAKTPYTHIDFYKALDASDVAQAVTHGVGDLLGKLESKPKQLLRLANDFFADLQVKFSMGELGLQVELHDQQKPEDKIQLILKKLHQFLVKRNKKAVFFIDEFQQIAMINGHQAIEAVIRHEAQISSHVSYVFSGSNRHLIEDMFFDNSRPFYKLCDTMHLTRIAAEHYTPYIQMAAQKRWQSELSTDALDTIFSLTQRHPYYVNLLCFKLWLKHKPSSSDVMQCWQQCAKENRSQIEREIDLLSVNQKRLLIRLSQFGATKHPAGKEFLNKLSMSSTSVMQALKILLAKDYIYQNDAGYYHVLDPMIQYLFKD